MSLSFSGAGLTPVITVLIGEEIDVVAARQRARQLASLVGFGTQDQVRIATAVSEIARNAYRHGGGRVEFALALLPRPQTLSITVVDNGPGIPDPDAVLSVRDSSSTGAAIGFNVSRRLMDSFAINSTPGKGTAVFLSKTLPPDSQRLEPSHVTTLIAQLTEKRLSVTKEVQIQNRDLLETLETLRLRDLELEKRHMEMRRINSELEETNRGVVALYAELDEKADALRNADELKGRFLRHVSHEFRTPLNSILALAGILLRRTDGDLTPEQERQVGFIRKAAQELTEIVNDLLDLAKVESGKTEVNFSRIYLAHLFGVLRGVMRPLITGDAVALMFEDPPEGFAFQSDESKISQILRNLISNALKFTEHGEVRVSYEVSKDWLKVSVSDTGIGIARGDQDRIFQEFSQLNNPIQKRVKGTGLGLPLSRKLATLLGGELNVSSQPGHGSTFTLRIPISADRNASGDQAEAAQNSILIIDDEEASRYIARRHFRGTRHRLIEAAGGIEGAERARFERPALILLDLAMRDRSGFDVLDDLTRDPATRGIPIIIHTSRRLGESDFKRLANRHAGVLPKGESWPPETLERIRILLGESDLFADEPAPNPPRP